MSQLNILELNPSHAFSLKEPAENSLNVTVIDEYELETTDLSPYNVLYITEFVDQEYLLNHKEVISDFLNNGNVVVFCGHLFRDWLPGCSLMMPTKINSYKDYYVQPVPGAPLFEGVAVEDMVYNKGIAGFFARGYYRAPKDAEVCLTFTDGKVITYIDRHTTNGTVIVHSGRSLLGYKSDSKTTGKIRIQMVALLEQEVAQEEA
ncbi:phosphate starvation-inducible protein PhoH [Bacillus sp. SD075]|uniref:phosphate starvation-inducible protein PhoH n=1 Tax=Bacillus sp. SD075 TaxID=2781732 RepID=UPI001A97AD2B|nr:phosphate starvation-inducible protein PhoH [Bacillus sp. SD075]MBO0998399.1 phosphate starvation-inducible protein PhoH [Bacillus sp. SD075]